MDEAEGHRRIAAALDLVPLALRAPRSESGVLDLSELSDGPDILPGGTTLKERKDLLQALGVIEVTRGAGGPARFTPNPEGSAKLIASIAAATWQRSWADEKGYVGDDGIREVVQERGGDDALRGNAVSLLKQLQLVGGVRRRGGIRRHEFLLAEAREAEAEILKADEQIEVGAERESTHESFYYEPAADALREDGFTVFITGVRRRRAGHWSTPDVVGYSLKPSRYLVQPIVRIATVEVKHVLDRSAIAEAAAHRRFAHYAFVAVPVSADDLSDDLVTACSAAQVGLICPRRRNSLRFAYHLVPPLHRPDEEDLEALLADLQDEDGTNVGELVSRQFRDTMAALQRA